MFTFDPTKHAIFPDTITASGFEYLDVKSKKIMKLENGKIIARKKKCIKKKKKLR